MCTLKVYKVYLKYTRYQCFGLFCLIHLLGVPEVCGARRACALTRRAPARNQIPALLFLFLASVGHGTADGWGENVTPQDDLDPACRKIHIRHTLQPHRQVGNSDSLIYYPCVVVGMNCCC